MRTIFILTIAISTSIQIHAQEIWKDYIIGRPMQGYTEAKTTCAQEWGIAYEAIMVGCVLSQEVEDKSAKQHQQNKKYFEVLASKFGKDWLRYFNLDVQKKMNIAYSSDTSFWVEPVIGKPYLNHFEAKKVVAKKWGINYTPEFLGCEVPTKMSAEMEQVLNQSNAYVARLNARFGADWQEEFNREVKLELAKRNAPIVPIPEDATQAKEVWIDCVLGKPYMPYFESKKAVAKEWGIVYAIKFMGCKRSKKSRAAKKRIDTKNEQYFVSLAQQYGKDWNKYFTREVQKKMAQIRLVQKQNQ